MGFTSLFDYPHPWDEHVRFLLKESNPSLLLRLLKRRPENPDSDTAGTSGMNYEKAGEQKE